MHSCWVRIARAALKESISSRSTDVKRRRTCPLSIVPADLLQVEFAIARDKPMQQAHRQLTIISDLSRGHFVTTTSWHAHAFDDLGGAKLAEDEFEV